MSNKYFFALISSIILNIVFIIWIKGFISRIVLAMALFVMLYGFVEKSFKRYITNKSGLLVRTIAKEEIYLYWLDVMKIEKISTRKNTFRVTDGSTTFFIAPNLKNFELLLVVVIKYCENISIEI